MCGSNIDTCNYMPVYRICNKITYVKVKWKVKNLISSLFKKEQFIFSNQF